MGNTSTVTRFYSAKEDLDENSALESEEQDAQDCRPKTCEEIQQASRDERDVENQPSNVIPQPILFDTSGKWQSECLPVYQVLYLAALKNDWRVAEPIFRKDPSFARHKISERGETVLHIAAAARSTLFVQELMNLIEEDDLELPDEDGSTAFHFAAASGVVEIAKAMRDKNENLPNIPGEFKTRAITMAALHGNKAMVSYLCGVTRLEELSQSERFNLLEATIQNDMYDVALDIFRKDRNLAIVIAEGDRSVLNVLAEKCLLINYQNSEEKSERLDMLRLKDAIERACWPLWRIFINAESTIPVIPWFMRIGVFQEKYLLKKQAGLLLKELWVECQRLPAAKLSELISKTEVLHSAAKAGNVEFLAVLIHNHPDLIWKVDQQGRTIFHVAVLHREEKVFSLIHQIGAIKDLITLIVDVDGNNILHLAGKLGQSIPLKQKLLQQLGEIEVLKQKLWQPMPCNAVFIGTCQQLIQKIQVLQQRLGEPTLFSIEMEEALQRKSSCEEARENLIRQIEFIKQTTEIECIKEGEKIMPPSFLRVSGAALRLQKEMMWFKEVEKIVPSLIIGMKNKDEKTPRQLFTEEHQLLLKEGERWMKDTANSCMIVAALIATMVFTAAFTVPGGNNDDEGTPIMLRLKGFTVFVISDAVALFSSIVSIIMFLSILTSRYTDDDFLVSLPRKLLFGLTTLFASIVSMLVAFAATFFLVYNNHMAWQPKLITAFAGVPIALFGSLQYKLWWDTAKSTYWSHHLFKPGKHRLY